MSRIPAVTPQDAGPLIKIACRFAMRRFDEVPEPLTHREQSRAFGSKPVDELPIHAGRSHVSPG